ncbi:MAG: ankyrin repeat domain-containing protein [Sphingomicrobium sp.]
MTIIRSWTKAVLALALALAPAVATAQGMGLNASDGEAFLNAIKDGDSNKALELVNQPGSRVANYRGYNGDTALHMVTRKRELDWVGFLLSRGADPNIGDSNGDTPMMIAASIGFEEAATQMLRRGARVDATNRRGETALTVAVQQRQPRVVELLLRAGANPDKADHVTGYSPRDYAKRDTRNPQLLKLIETIKPAAKKAVSGPVIN